MLLAYGKTMRQPKKSYGEHAHGIGKRSLKYSAVSLIFLLLLLVSFTEKKYEKKTECPLEFWPYLISRIKSSHHQEDLHLQTNSDMKALNRHEAEALHFKLRRFRSKSWGGGGGGRWHSKDKPLEEKKKKGCGLHTAKFYKFRAMVGHSPFPHSLAEMKTKIGCALWFQLGQRKSKACEAKFVFWKMFHQISMIFFLFCLIFILKKTLNFFFPKVLFVIWDALMHRCVPELTHVVRSLRHPGFYWEVSGSQTSEKYY